MAAQGWAGSSPPPQWWACASCLLGGRDRPARTLVDGTAFCQEHVPELKRLATEETARQ